MEKNNTPQIRFKGFTDAWEQRKLGELFEEYSEKGHDELPALTIIQGGGTVRRDESDRNLQYDKSSLSNYKLVNAGDFVVHLRSFEGGLEKAKTLGIISPAYHTFHGKNTDSRFYYLYFRSPEFIDADLKPHVYGIRDGRSIDIEGMKTIKIPYTNFEEQKEIGLYFKHLDNLITLHQRKVSLLKQLKNSLINKFYPNITNKISKEYSMIFDKESEFESALINLLFSKGWDNKVLKYKTEEELIDNWKSILFDKNKSRDKLNDVPLTDTEMAQIINIINLEKTPLKLNNFINGKTVLIKRDNPDDPEHLGKEISLEIYDRLEIAGGTSRYQIAQQPIFKSKSQLGRDRRGDFMLLINGMPLIHVELKKSGVPVSQACNQIEKYTHEGVFSSGIFSLVQVFVAMNPDETVYFANPGFDGKFNKDYFFHWADFNNEPINDWKSIADKLLSIPMAHQLIGFYTVGDNTDGILKVMRSYQYYACNKISSRVASRDWAAKDIYGGHIWHTTGSGKTLTSFKSAQLIANSKDADKVVFLMDRIELGTQSLLEYQGFAGDMVDVQATENTDELVSKLKSPEVSDTLIVTSIQKMSNIEYGKNRDRDIDIINEKRIVFIVDECHRSTFGDMMTTIKKTFPMAMFFGFTGTPIKNEIALKGMSTADIFGDELHRYSIADGIRDKNVLGFDPYMVSTYKEKDLRRAIALQEAKVDEESNIFGNPEKEKIYYYYMNDCPMAGYTDDSGKFIKGIEDFVPKSQYESNHEHQLKVVEDIKDNFSMLSHGGKFHAILAVSSIPVAIEYYHLLKSKTDLKITALFDENDSNNSEFSITKSDAIIEILKDYNGRYEQSFKLANFSRYKKDVAYRLAHKEMYKNVEKSKQIDLLIVVNQMLTGFDSKWVNTLYMDKMLQYQHLIQAFSRTNRLFGPEKPFGVIRYYRYPFTMKQNVENAFKMFSGDKPLGLFADKLEKNLISINNTFIKIKNLFENAEIVNFVKLPDENSEKAKFAKLFRELNKYLEAAKLQCFIWDKLIYTFKDTDGKRDINILLNENTYLVLAKRYKELFSVGPIGPGVDAPFDIEGYLTEIDTGKIDFEYMNSRFTKYLKILNTGSQEEIDKVKNELHASFANLSSEEQKYANLFLNDIESGDAVLDDKKSFRDYVNEYMIKANNDTICKVASSIGVDERMLREFKALKVTETDIDKYGRFDKLKDTIDIDKAKNFFESKTNTELKKRQIIILVDEFLRNYLIHNIADIDY
ncbi:MAG: type I restriction endonuclease subunit R, EcoR124 family [Eubacterium sp.]